jgi:hypothetical protein
MFHHQEISYCQGWELFIGCQRRILHFATEIAPISMKSSTRRKALSPALKRYGLATGAALAAATPASAAIIFNTGHAFSVNNGTHTANWDIDGGGVVDFYLRYFPGSATIVIEQSNVGNAFVKGAGTNGQYMQRLVAGVDHVGPSLGVSRFQTGHEVVLAESGSVYGGLLVGTQDVGFKFVLNSQTDYGWANITLTPTYGSANLTVNNWAYDNSGSAITVGEVPEPADAALGLGLLALGAVGVAEYRKRKLASIPGPI